MRATPPRQAWTRPWCWPAVILAIALVLGSSACGGNDGSIAPAEITAKTTAPFDFGFSPGAGLRDEDDAHVAGDLDAMRAAGAGWVRLDIDWSVIEAEPGHYDWSSSDRLIGEATAREFEVLALVAYTPTWARPQGSSDKNQPQDNERFATFAAEAVSRYRPQGVRAWQVWNEPNSPLFWQPKPDPVTYGELLVATSSAIRAEDPGATIISGGLAPAVDEPDRGWIAPETFLRQLVDSKALDEIDAVGIHPYSFPARPLDEDSADWNTFLRLPDLHRLLIETKAGPEQIWITEYGAPTGSHGRSIDETDQAVLITDVLKASDRWPWLGPTFLYSFRDFRDEPNDLEWNYGILNHDGSPKQAWHELLALTTAGEGG